MTWSPVPRTAPGETQTHTTTTHSVISVDIEGAVGSDMGARRSTVLLGGTELSNRNGGTGWE